MAAAHDRVCDGRPSAYETRHDDRDAKSLSETIIDAVATAKGVDPTDSDLAFYEVVDLEALDALFERRNAESDAHWRFEFSVGEHLVVVTGSGRVAVYED